MYSLGAIKFLVSEKIIIVYINFQNIGFCVETMSYDGDHLGFPIDRMEKY
jgi:hypothetical protein